MRGSSWSAICVTMPPEGALPTSSHALPSHRQGRSRRRWRVVLLRNNGEILGTVEAPDVAAAKAAAADQFDLDDVQRGRIIVQELR